MSPAMLHSIASWQAATVSAQPHWHISSLATSCTDVFPSPRATPDRAEAARVASSATAIARLSTARPQPLDGGPLPPGGGRLLAPIWPEGDDRARHQHRGAHPDPHHQRVHEHLEGGRLFVFRPVGQDHVEVLQGPAAYAYVGYGLRFIGVAFDAPTAFDCAQWLSIPAHRQRAGDLLGMLGRDVSQPLKGECVTADLDAFAGRHLLLNVRREEHLS